MFHQTTVSSDLLGCKMDFHQIKIEWRNIYAYYSYQQISIIFRISRIYNSCQPLRFCSRRKSDLLEVNDQANASKFVTSSREFCSWQLFKVYWSYLTWGVRGIFCFSAGNSILYTDMTYYSCQWSIQSTKITLK